MKNPQQKNLRSKTDEKLIHSTPTSHKKPHLMRLLVFGSMLCSLMFVSCADDTFESDPSVLDTKADLAFTLAPAESELIQINGTSNSLENEFSRSTDAAGVDRGRFNITF